MGRRYRIAKSNELLVDLDKSNPEFGNILNIIKATGKVKVLDVLQTPSKSEGHSHIIVTLDSNLPVTERLFLQACLGSDPIREILSWSRAGNGDTAPVLFMEPDDDSGDLSCEHDIGYGRCDHLDKIQESNPLVQYGQANK